MAYNTTRMIKSSWIKLVIIGVAVSIAQVGLAHSGSGVPYVLINGQYAQANPIAGSYADIAQDAAPEIYLVGQPLTFKVDRTQIAASAFRWQWSSDKSDTKEGPEQSHSFGQPGSKIVTLQVKDDASGNFLDIDPITVNVVASKGYQLPGSKVKVTQVSSSANEHTVSLEAITTTDPSTQIKNVKWQFGDGSSGQGKVVQHRYQGSDLSLFPRLTVTDGNGLVADLIFSLDAMPGKAIVAQSIPALPDVVVARTASKPDQNWLLPAAIVGALIVGSLLLLQIRRLRRSN